MPDVENSAESPAIREVKRQSALASLAEVPAKRLFKGFLHQISPTKGFAD